MKIKKIMITTLLVAIVMLFSGCSKFNVEIKDLITPPEPTGELYEIRQALFEYTGTDITLRYPKSGNWRSAFIIEDIDGNGVNDALAFYSTISGENTTVMHVNLIAKLEGKWVSVSDNAVESSAIESVEFLDLNNDKTPEVLIRWKIASQPTDKLSVFTFSNGGLTLEIQEDCSCYLTCNLSEAEEEEFVIISTDSIAKKATATGYRIDKRGVINLGRCPLDVDATEYSEAVVSKLSNGKPAIYIDAVKSTHGTITEVLHLSEDGVLENVFVKEDETQNTATLRASTAESYDIDGDEIPEIPLLRQLPSIRGTTEKDILYLTEWNKCDEQGLDYLSSDFMNYNDGYSFSVDDDWKDKFTIARSGDASERIFYEYNEEMALATHELFRIKAVTKDEYYYSSKSYHEYFEIASDDANIYLGKINPENEWGITEQDVKDRFDFIKTAEEK